MAAVGACQLTRTPKGVQINGEDEIPFGKVSTISGEIKDWEGKDSHKVMVLTRGGMGLRNRDVFFTFKHETAEKTCQFFRGLLEIDSTNKMLDSAEKTEGQKTQIKQWVEELQKQIQDPKMI